MRTIQLFGVLAAVAALGACAGPDAGTVRTEDSGTLALPAPAPDAPPAPAQQVGSAAAPTGVTSPRQVIVHGVDLTGIGYDRGSPTAPVVVVNFSDFGCPYCGSFARETQPALEQEYVRSGKVFFKYVPFVMGMFPNGSQAARAAECAGDQGKFWAMHDRLYERQSEWKRSSAPDKEIQGYAASLGLDAGEFAGCYVGNGMHPRTITANGATERLGVRATPSFSVNGRGIEGALPLPQFRQLIESTLAGEP